MRLQLLVLTVLTISLAGCSLFGAAGPEATPTEEIGAEVAVVPTFTPTTTVVVSNPQTESADATPAATEAAAQQAAAQQAAAQQAAAQQAAAQQATEPPAALLPTPTSATQSQPSSTEPASDAASEQSNDDASEDDATAPDGPQLLVVGEIVNVRSGPGTDYATVGTAAAGDRYALTGRNDAGDWWQVCCFGDAPGWLYGPLVSVEQAEGVALAADIPPAPTVTREPVEVAVEAPAPAEPVADESTSQDVAPVEAEATTAPVEEPAPVVDSGTAGVFDPDAQYHIIGYRVLGFYENNGGIFNNGGQHMIFINVVDANGNGIDGAVIRNAINDSNNRDIVTGPKGPGRAEFEMFGIRHKLYVASDPSGPVTSQVTNQMDTVWPHIPDIIGQLGPPEEEFAICPTVDDRCEPPFYHAHWSYEVTFQKVK